MLILFLAVVGVLLASAICSGTEAALFSIPVVKVKQLAQKQSRSSLALLKIRENMTRPIAAIVVLNNVANIVGSIMVGNIAAEVLGGRWLGLFSGMLTFLVIIFSEIIPKTLGERYAEKIALSVARPLLGVTKTLTLILWCIEKITSPLTQGGDVQLTTDESEIKLLASIGQKEGVIEEHESELIQRSFDLDNTTAKQLMTPRVAMTYLLGNLTLNEAKDQIIDSQHSRIVVVDESPDEVIGVALKDVLLTALIQGKGQSQVSELSQSAHFVPETVPANKLLVVFQSKKKLLAIVTDEYGGVSGVVTLEDVVEILTGEIVDETDRSVDLQEEARKNKVRDEL